MKNSRGKPASYPEDAVIQWKNMIGRMMEN